MVLDIDPNGTLFEALRTARQAQGKKDITTVLTQSYPARLVQHLSEENGYWRPDRRSVRSSFARALRQAQKLVSGANGQRMGIVLRKSLWVVSTQIMFHRKRWRQRREQGFM